MTGFDTQLFVEAAITISVELVAGAVRGFAADT